MWELMSDGSREFNKGRKALLFTSMGHFTNDGTVFLVPVIIDLIAVAGHAGPLLITAALTVFYASTAVSANLLSPLIDRRKWHAKGMVFGLLSLSGGLVLFSVAVQGYLVPLFLLVSAAVTGFGASFYHPTGSSILQSQYKGPRLGWYLGINGSAGSIGRAIYPALLLAVGLLFTSNSYSVAFFGVLGLLLSLLISAGLRGYESDAGEDRKKKTIEGASEDNGKKRSVATSAIAVLAVISLMRSIAFSGIIAWIPEYLSFERGIGGGVSLGTTLTLMFSGGIVGQLFFGKLVERYDKRLSLMVSTIFSALSMFLYLITSGVFSLSMLVMFGFFNFTIFPIFMSMISDYIPKGSTTASNALVWNLGGTGGQAIGPLVAGVLIGSTYTNIPLIFEILLVFAVISAIIAMTLPRPSRVSKVALFG